MFLAFAQDSSGEHYVAIVNGAMADLALEWFNDNESVPTSLSLADIPTMRFPNPDSSNLTSAVWVKSKIHLDKFRTGKWKWGPKGQLPPIQPDWQRMISMSAEDRPVYRCTNMGEDATPKLDLLWCTGTVANISLMDAQMVQIMAMNPLLPNLLRQPAEPHFSSSACHEHDHNHDEASSDDSGPPQPGPSSNKRRRPA